MRAAAAAVKVLEAFGVRYAFAVPGESFLGMLDALHDSSIQLIAARHEGGAAFMAEAVGKLTGIPAICMGTRGVGTSNLTIGIHTAYQDSTPLIAMLGQVETPHRSRDAFQEVELAPFLSHITKWAVEVPAGNRLPDLVKEGLRRSVTGRPGPVALALRGDILDEPAPDEIPVLTALPSSAPRLSDARAALQLLANARRPLIIAGGGVLRSGATAELVAFAEQTGIPVMSGFRRNDVFPNQHPLFLGGLTLRPSAATLERVRQADVIMAIGSRLGEPTTVEYSIPVAGTQLIQVDVAPDELGKSFPAAIAIMADAKETLQTFCSLLGEQQWPDRSASNEQDRTVYESESTPPTASTVRSLVDPALVFAELQRQLPAEAILTSDAGNFYSWLARYYRFSKPGTFLAPTSGAMGYGVPSAVAAALVKQSQVPVVALAGDGGFLMTGSELAVAAQHDLNVTCIVFNNAMYGTIRMHQENAYPGRVSGTELWSPDFVKYAESFGGLGVRVDDNQDIVDGLRQVLAHRGVSLLEVITSRDSLAVGRFLD